MKLCTVRGMWQHSGHLVYLPVKHTTLTPQPQRAALRMYEQPCSYRLSVLWCAANTTPTAVPLVKKIARWHSKLPHMRGIAVLQDVTSHAATVSMCILVFNSHFRRIVCFP